MVAHTNDDGTLKGSKSAPPSLGVVGGGVGKHNHHALVLKKGPWMAAEDTILMEYVKKHGEGNWNAVQKNTSLVRCGKSCRLRWTNHLRPNLRKGSFTPEEERLILQLHSQIGNKWARMAAQLPGRTDNEIKNYWNTRIKRRIRQGLPLYHQEINPRNSLTPPPPELQSTTTTTGFRARPPREIPTRNLSQTLCRSPSQTTSCNNLSLFDPSISSINFNNSSSLMYPTPNLNHFPLPLPITSSMCSSFPQSILPNTNSFQFTPLSFNMNSPQSLHTLFETESHCPIYGNKELPSNQMYLFQTEKPEIGTMGKPESSRGLLEDLFKEAEAFVSPQDEKFDFSLKESVSMLHEDLSKLLDFPSNLFPLTPDRCNGNGGLEEDQSPGYASGLTDDGLGLEMQHIASLFNTDYNQTEDPASCSWDNLPRMC